LTHRDRLRALIRLPWIIARLWRALDAWGDSDWALMVSLLQPIAEKNLDTDTDRVLLGLAHTRLVQFDQAIWYFEQVTGKRLLQRGGLFTATHTLTHSTAAVSSPRPKLTSRGSLASIGPLRSGTGPTRCSKPQSRPRSCRKMLLGLLVSSTKQPIGFTFQVQQPSSR
jgi:hypothetical protein